MIHAPKILSHPSLAIDTETTGLDPYTCDLVSVQIANAEDNTVHILDVRKDNFQQFFNWLKTYKGTVYFQNAKFDLKFLKTVYNLLYLDIYDTWIAEKLLYAGIKENGHGLGILSKNYLDIDMDKSVRNEFTLPLFSNLDLTETQLQYGALDAWVLPRIAEHQQHRIQELGLERILDLEHRVVPVVAKMELKGFLLDTEKWTQIYEEEVIKADKLKKQMFEVAGRIFNPNSPQQLKEIFKELDIPVPVVYGKETTKAEFIFRIDHEFVKALLEYRTSAKRASTYGKDFLDNVHPITGRIHAEFNQLGTDTGRFSSDSPNMQNIPKRGEGDERFRQCFIAPDGHKIVSCDYSQQEIRVMAEVSRDPELIRIYTEGLDRHTATAANLFEVKYDSVEWWMRRIAKDFNFGASYGSSAWNLANKLELQIETVEEHLKNYWEIYKVLQKWTRRAGLLAWTRGYSETLWGRRRWYDTENMRKDEVMRQGANHVIQGSSGDMLKLGMVYTDEAVRDGTTIMNTVHDEQELEALDVGAEAVAFSAKEAMENAGKEFVTIIPQPADIQIGDYWM
jgi:DNA polymerase-1